ncbi:amidohydrolase [Roseateles sp. BYS180W]|uniref:Amidohydrolase n=1 Tax=Roseateles rivi TaxID=3299028 RepID=A0ABW7FWR0_9BURK
MRHSLPSRSNFARQCRQGLVALSAVYAAVAWAQADTGLQHLAGQMVAPSEETVVYLARDILTMDPQRPRAQAVAVRGGRFVAVGTQEDVLAKVQGLKRVDTRWRDKVLLPGFVEQHVHPVLAALTMSTKVISIEDWDTMDGFSPAVRDEKNYQKRLRAALAAHKDKRQAFVSWGYHNYMHGKLDRALLDKLAPDFPVIIWHRSGHEFYLNSMALKKAGLDTTYVSKLDASAQHASSLERGHFYEQGALAILPTITPMMATPALFRKGLQYTVQYYHRNGITLACEPGGFYSKPLQQMINAVYSADATPFNHCFIGDGKTFAAAHPEDPQAMVQMAEEVQSWGSGRTFYLPKQVKFLADGAIFSQLMQMRDGYADGHKGAWIMDPPVLKYAFQNFWDAGYQLHIHNNGDAGLDVVLGELEAAMKRNPRSDHRTVLVHFGFAAPEQIKRWGELGGIISANPYYVTALAGRYGDLNLGERAKDMVPLGEVMKNGISVSFHSDMPMAPAKPLQLVWAAVNRSTYEGEVVGPRHRMDVLSALKAVTLDAAYSIRQERRVGSVEVGKQADLVVLEASPDEVAPGDIKNIGVWGTMLEGRVQAAPKAPGHGPRAATRPQAAAPAATTLSATEQARAVADAGLMLQRQLAAHSH